MVKQLVTVDLDETAPARVRDILSAAPRLRVRAGNTAQLHVADNTWPLVILSGITPFARATAPVLANLVDGDHVALVVAERLLLNVRRELENAGVSYVDSSGAVHLEAPGLLVHIEPGSSAKTGVVPPPRGLGVVAVRLIQYLLAEPDRGWTVTELAEVGGASLGQAHNVFQRLDREGFITEERVGKAIRRRIVSPSDLLEWLARVPAARKFPSRLRTYLYAPDAGQLVTTLAHHAHETDITWALTGAAAARAYGARVVTALPVVTVRVGPRQTLEEAAGQLHLEPVDSGHNVLLVTDTGEVGTRSTARNGPVVMAPPVRVWLDMLSETRGDDAAALFREGVLGY